MIIFLAGWVSGNLKPLWHQLAIGKNHRESYETFLGRRRDKALDTNDSD
jgi:hypothetical protein